MTIKGIEMKEYVNLTTEKFDLDNGYRRCKIRIRDLNIIYVDPISPYLNQNCLYKREKDPNLYSRFRILVKGVKPNFYM